MSHNGEKLSRWGAARRMLVMGLWFSLTFGLIEVGVLQLLRYGMGRLVWLSADLPWMIPFSYALILAGPTLVLAAVSLRWPNRAYRLGVYLFALVGFFSLLFMIPQLHHYATFVLAAGLAVTTVRIVAGHSNGFENVVRYTTPAMAAVVILTAVAMTLGSAAWERRAVQRLPEARTGAPNILLIILDTVRASRLSVYGYPRPTSPALEQLAARAVTFDWALATSPTSLPSHASMFTGRFTDGSAQSSAICRSNAQVPRLISARLSARTGFSKLKNQRCRPAPISGS